MRAILTLLFSSFLFGCLPQQTTPRNLGNEQAEVSDNNTDTTNATQTTTDIKWFSKNNFLDVLTLNSTNKENGFLTGDLLSSFLSKDLNFRNTYCLVINFQISSTNVIKQLRVKSIPIQVPNTLNGQVTRLLRINFNEEIGNDICDVDTLDSISSNNQVQIINRPASIAFKVDDVCPDCLNFVSSTELKLFKLRNLSGRTLIEQVSQQDVSLSKLTFRIDMNNLAINNAPSCTNNSCISQGFDCCQNGQCVKEGAVKESAKIQDPDGFAIAEAQKLQNPLSYLQNSKFYFICNEAPPLPEVDLVNVQGPENPELEAQERLAADIADFNCINELIEKSTSNPFHEFPVDVTKNYSKCNINDNSNNMFFETVMTRMYKKCGCDQDVFNLMVEKCPKYTYSAQFSDSNNQTPETITSIECVSPQVSDLEVPLQNVNVTVSAKTAPHRYFTTQGNEINIENPPGPLENTNQEPEGEKFEYLDPVTKSFPRNGELNMQSILGHFSVNLDQARPAKILTVKNLQTYFLSVRLGGAYTPCPTCGRDSWLNNFFAHPQTTNGLGLMATGHQSSRDEFSNNTSLGNYEDTIFGRACWLPPTMIAYAHHEGNTSQSQRLQRLKTQAAMFINGYQRDWYGFNKGALIGSFDGVKWFAIGKSRRVRATSNKLYLAINAPFADLTNDSSHSVLIREDDNDGGSIATEFDYDPNFDLVSPFQNEAGQCQAHHMCETDSDCITTLGWEYVCSNVASIKTKWPKFDVDSNELPNDSLDTFLKRVITPPTGSLKRCVYRGAGAPCRRDVNTISDLNLKKSMACAPNFHCAELTKSLFNKEVARSSQPITDQVIAINHLFGQDANVLGRPLHYIKNSGNDLHDQDFITLNDVKENIYANIKLQDPNLNESQIGLCRPGKNLGNILPLNQLKNEDLLSRTDYINQISSCNSESVSKFKFNSCPVIDSDGNYNYLKASNDILNSSDLSIPATSQNMCGLETVENGNDDKINGSPFKLIEAGILGGDFSLTEKTLVRDACLRKAGSICHTDLDCGPNKLMADKIALFGEEFFGNPAEKSYYEEFLICGQEKPIPSPGDLGFEDYSVKNNRCCREVGKDLTIYSENIPGLDFTNTDNLNVDRFGGFSPNDSTRYSRFSTLGLSVDTNTKLAQFDDNVFPKPKAAATNVTLDNQWKTIGKAAQNTCCGGGYIRKFADGTNNWRENRLVIDPRNFLCLNTMTPLITTNTPSAFGVASQAILNRDKSSYCVDSSGSTSSCAIYNFSKGLANGTQIKPKILTPSIANSNELQELYFDQTNMADIWGQTMWAYSFPTNAGGQPDQIILNWSLDFDADNVRKNIQVFLPTWVAYKSANNFSNEVKVHLGTRGEALANDVECEKINDSGELIESTDFYNVSRGTACNEDINTNGCCYEYDHTSRILKISFKGDDGVTNTTTNPGLDDDADPNNYVYAKDDFYAKITFTAPGSVKWEKDHGDKRASLPGDENYYLSRLSRFELVGIPQITYLPIYCNNNYEKLVPGLFNEDIDTVEDFNDNSFSAGDDTLKSWRDDENIVGISSADTLNKDHVTTQDKLAIQPIFSSHEFMCCQKLGNTTDDPNKCCSGLGVAVDGTNEFQCKLPAGTDLHVYFNRYVSNEGFTTNEANNDIGLLTLEDFDAKTGEPKMNETVFNKVRSLGVSFCEFGTVTRGGAFGEFSAEIAGHASSVQFSQFNIVDNSRDIAQEGNEIRGFSAFTNGFRWNHHIYCSLDGN